MLPVHGEKGMPAGINWARSDSGATLATVLPCINITLHCITLPYTALPCIALVCIALHCVALPCTALICLALHCAILHTVEPNCRQRSAHEQWSGATCVALHCVTLLCVKLH